MMAFCEGLAGQGEQEFGAGELSQAYARERTAPARNLYKNYIIDFLPTKPFPMEDVIQTEMENLTATVPEFRGKNVGRLHRQVYPHRPGT